MAMSHLENISAIGSTIIEELRTYYLRIDRPVLFGVALIFWFGLLVYTCKRQTTVMRRRQLSAEIKSMQFEIRRTLKREQEAVDLVKLLLRSGMANIDLDAGNFSKLELEDLRSVVDTITCQLTELERRLDSFDRQVR